MDLDHESLLIAHGSRCSWTGLNVGLNHMAILLVMYRIVIQSSGKNFFPTKKNKPHTKITNKVKQRILRKTCRGSTSVSSWEKRASRFETAKPQLCTKYKSWIKFQLHFTLKWRPTQIRWNMWRINIYYWQANLLNFYPKKKPKIILHLQRPCSTFLLWKVSLWRRILSP